ncbi:lysine-specific demethylase 5B [Hyperolius riggenbachi]|uniref:lysine-specific demethylase 5B n=1 Tax=Hyperolius riggenbachi TaxID=752182 RepID=UPI0035A2B7C6
MRSVSAGLLRSSDMEFVPPPECPVFEPSREEFADPFAFINKIRPIAERTGICKVRPPPDWQPPFACDVDKLHFTPRIQRLNELEAQTRVKLNFLDQIAKFWELQGCALKIPHVERKILDLFQLNKLVVDEGGFDIVCRERKWTKIAIKMGFSTGKAIGSHIRGHYERILYPYNLFQNGSSVLAPESNSKISEYMDDAIVDKKPIFAPDIKEKEYKPHDIPQRQSVQPLESCAPARRAKRMKAEDVKVKMEPGETPELRQRTLRRRMGSTPSACENDVTPVHVKRKPVEPVIEKPKKTKKSRSAVDLYVCLLCGSGSDEDRLLLCDGCDDSYHTFCLIPPLNDVPKGDWRCPKCLAQECSKPQEAFGFEQASRDYTLRMFGEMADNFKSDYFNMPVHMVPTELVEKEFWRLVSTIEEDVTVEYGADIASKEFGSGFPVRNGKFRVKPEDEEYIDCGWNLNNMPVMEPSVLTYITADICGMKLPWLYVGMCFSSFCWHIEDHWSYSINYLHWGEPKTWYGAPGYAAEQLEEVMKKLAPELFVAQPDLLHQLVTIMNPNTLMSHGVPIYRTNQCAGEFVITFPRAYHSGFNQGFNFAEAVNFCTVDWLPLGRQCVEHYRLLNRYCVFSHDEMICKMANRADELDVVLASSVQKDLAAMIDEEKALREAVRKMGVLESEEIDLELLADDERQCVKCKTTCFMSAVYCPCQPNALVCLYHVDGLCSCPKHKYILGYRYTLDDLFPMMNAVKLRAESYDSWASEVVEALKSASNKRNLSSLQLLMEVSESKKFPENDLLRHLRAVVQDAEKCGALAQQLLNGKRHTRFRSGGGKSQNHLTVAELRSFVKQLHCLPCNITQTPQLKDLLNRVEEFQSRSQKLLAADMPKASDLQQLLDSSFQFDLELPIESLRERLEQARWLEEQQQACQDPGTLTLDVMRRLIDLGVGLAPHPTVEKAMAKLQELLTMSEQWDDQCKRLLKARPRQSLGSMTAALQEAESIPAYLPSVDSLKDAVQRAQEWLRKVETLQSGARVPVLDTLIELVNQGRAIPVHLGPLPRLETLVGEVQVWTECATSTFLTSNSPYTLLEVLCPRCDVGIPGLKRKMRKVKDQSASGGKKKYPKPDGLLELEKALTESKDTASAMAALGEARLCEMDSLHAIRISNENRILSRDEQRDWKVCICQGEPVAPMIQCELCRACFHSGCVNAQRNGSQVWLCPQCHRSRKPPLEKILPLLASLQRLRVRLPEGDALRYLIERTVNWQHQAQHMMSSGELKLVQERLSTSHFYNRWQATAGQLAETSSVSQSVGATSFSLPHEWDNRTVYITSPFSPGRNCIPLNSLSTELDKLLMEAQLLQVSLPEVQELYQALMTPSTTISEGSLSPTGRERGTSKQQGTEWSSARSEAVHCFTKRERSDSTEKKLKRRHEGTERRMKKTPAPRKKRVKTLRSKEVCSREQRPDRDSDSQCSFTSESEDENAICPADHCMEPEGDEVDWVQCDGSCNRWFHQVCVGVSAETAEKEDYVCAHCNDALAAVHK